MSRAIDTYLGWETLQHRVGCKRPAWSVDVRDEPRKWRDRHGGAEHKCTNDVCGHDGYYAQTTMRIVCRSCQTATVIRGEDCHTSQGQTANTAYGYGLPPRQAAGLLLWPGEPTLGNGRLLRDEPYDFVVTRTGVKRVTEADVVGQINQDRGRRGGVIWHATAVSDPNGEFGFGQRIRWAYGTGDGSPLRSVGAAARWVGARLAEHETGGGQR
ncbi:hypothetical protein [Streptomyces sp. NPDC057877]|uniref:hypothetical protein n=1 Tax=Streptomyces sp. NPDC057877 TaxID=3346269 RepID=UPI0036BD952D